MTKRPTMTPLLSSLRDTLRSIPSDKLPPAVRAAFVEVHDASDRFDAASLNFDAAMVRLEEVLAAHGIVVPVIEEGGS